MKNTIKATLVALAVVGVASAARATYTSGDLLVGFTLQTGNDVVFDLGTAANLTDGETWSLNSILAPNGANGNSFTLNDPAVKWGVIGSQNIAGHGNAWETKASGLPPVLSGNSGWSTAVNANVTGIGGASATLSTAGTSGTIGSGVANSWNQQMIASTSTGSYHKAFTDPDATGYTTINFYHSATDGTAASLLGTFGFDNTGTLTFDAVSVPEPSMYGMFAAAVVLLVGLRNQFRRKQA